MAKIKFALTSVIAYSKAIEDGIVKTCMGKVFNVIELNKNINAKIISKVTGIAINNVTARINELRYDFKYVKGITLNNRVTK